MRPKITTSDAADILGITLQAVHKQLKTKKLQHEKTQNRVFFEFETARSLFAFDFPQRIVAAQIVKGGTGKTSLISALAVRANLYGARVLCVDMDQQANLTESFSVDPEEMPCMVDILNEGLPIGQSIVQVLPGLDLLPSRIENAVLDNTLMLKRFPLDRVYKERFDALREKYDLILIDCPPALGQSVAAVALAADLVLAPVTPEKFSLSGLRVTNNEISNLEETYKREIPVRIALNKFDNRTALSHEALSNLVKHPRYGKLLCRSYVRVSQEFPNTSAKGQSIFDSLRASAPKEDIDLLTRELLCIGSFGEGKASEVA